MIAKACVDALIEGPNISNSDREGLGEFADSSSTLHETLKEMNAMSEMILCNLEKMSIRLDGGMKCNGSASGGYCRVLNT